MINCEFRFHRSKTLVPIDKSWYTLYLYHVHINRNIHVTSLKMGKKTKVAKFVFAILYEHPIFTGIWVWQKFLKMNKKNRPKFRIETKQKQTKNNNSDILGGIGWVARTCSINNIIMNCYHHSDYICFYVHWYQTLLWFNIASVDLLAIIFNRYSRVLKIWRTFVFFFSEFSWNLKIKTFHLLHFIHSHV